MLIRRTLGIVCVLVFASMIVTSAAVGITNPSRTTYFTFSAPVQIPGGVLTPGTYVFDLASPFGDPSVVRIRSRHGVNVHFMALTRKVVRPHTQKLDAAVVFGEAKAGPRPIKEWYPAGELDGREFIY
jgi:hypothetical protein